MAESKADQVSRGLSFENDLRNLFRQLKFREVDGGIEFKLDGFQIDAIARHEDAVVIAESVTAFGRRKLDFRNEISSLRGKIDAVKRALRKIDRYKDYETIRFVLVTNVQADDEARKLAGEDPKVYLWSKGSLDYYRELGKKIGDIARNGLLAELDIKPRVAELITTPCLRAELGGATVFSFFIEPKKILRYAYVARREITQEDYYQRMVQLERLRKIAYYVTKENGFFPNNIILAFTPDQYPKYVSVREAREGLTTWPSWLDFGVLTFPQSYRACWVVDGQHRLFSFTQIEETDLKLPVVALAKIPTEEQARFFLDINSKQKPVPPDLLWDLQGQLRPNSEEGVISRIAKTVNELDPLKGKIYIPSRGLKAKGQLRLAGICNTMKRRRFIRGQTENMTQKQLNPLHDSDPAITVTRTAKSVSAYYRYVTGNTSDPLLTEFVYQNSGLSIFLGLYERIIAYLERTPTEHDLQHLVLPLLNQMTEQYASPTEVHALKLRCNSEGGRDEVTDELVSITNELTNENLPTSTRTNKNLGNKLALLERDLRATVDQTLSRKDPNWAKTCTPGTLYQDLKGRARSSKSLSDYMTLSECLGVITHGSNWAMFKPIFLDARYGFDSVEGLSLALGQISTIRNAIQHGRPLKWRYGDRQIVDSYMEKLRKVIDLALGSNAKPADVPTD